ncbi:hypothetical protein CYMTET_24036 [Cymbomonas tetramitiformis]|uniref:Methyltransferase domain-containing protein n=1 Tax=Cymbomonas tetramitiformis TaxID=36881 RepID=A0AAE0L0M4_9CHLO|nr:hypothetical protein CYMTET_24036 [Cymbomonas tetramitiformis]
MILCAQGFQLSPKFFVIAFSVLCLRNHVDSAVHNFTEETDFFKHLEPAFGRTDGWKVAPPTCSYPSDDLNLLAGENRTNLKTQVLRESLGFLRGELSWKQRRNTHYWQLSRQSHSYDIKGKAYFQRNWEPSISCEQEARIGIMGDGGKWVCNPANIPKDKCILYSFGSNLEFSFEVGIHEQLGCEIHTFDPTVAKHRVDAVKPEYVNYHYYGLGRDSTVVPRVGQGTKVAEAIDDELEAAKSDEEDSGRKYVGKSTGTEANTLVRAANTPGSSTYTNITHVGAAGCRAIDTHVDSSTTGGQTEGRERSVWGGAGETRK